MIKNKKFLKIAYYLQAGKIYEFFLKCPSCVILAYHRVCPVAKENRILEDMSVAPEEFQWQVEYVKRHYNVISLPQLKNYFLENKNGFFKSVIITFDDSYADNYKYAFPILKKYNLPATMFIPTDYIDTKKIFWWDRLEYALKKTKKEKLVFDCKGIDNELSLSTKNDKQKAFKIISHIIKDADDQDTAMDDLFKVLEVPDNNSTVSNLSWQEVKEMSGCGISFGAHTHSHRVLSALSEIEQKEEICKPKKILEQQLDQKVVDFAYPYGEKRDFNQETIDIVKSAGYERAFTMLQGLVFSDSDNFCLRRIGVGSSDFRESFKLKLTGLIPLIKK